MHEWSLDRVFNERVQRAPERTFLDVVGEGRETYSECYRASLRLSSALRRVGLKPQDTVVIMSGSNLTAIHAWLGVGLGGGIDVSINTAYRGLSLEHAINTVRAEIIIVERQFLSLLRESEKSLPFLKSVLWFGKAEGSSAAPLPRFERLKLISLDEMIATCDVEPPFKRAYNDIASIIYTSGTTGPAKGVKLSSAQTFHLARQTVQGVRLVKDDVFYNCHPLFHIAGKFMAIYAMMHAGGKIVVDSGFDASKWVDGLRESGATVGIAHGPMIEMIFAQPERATDDDHKLARMIVVPLPKRIGAEFQRRFGTKTIEVWGMTEVNVPCWQPYDTPSPFGSCGKVDAEWFDLQIVDPDTDQEMRCGEAGEIVVRPKKPWTIMQGYVDAPEATLDAWRNLWFHTGDLGLIDQDGFVFILDRLGDRIRRRSENISSYDVESAVMEHPAILECAVIGVPSKFEGDDDIKLVVVAVPGSRVTHDELLHFLVDKLPHFMVPRFIEFVSQLPRTPTNKVKKAELRAAGHTENTWDRKAAGIALRDVVDLFRNQL